MQVPNVEPSAQASGPLAGLKVLELGQLIAGPFAAKTLADFGADVVKIEPPADPKPGAGDPLRKWRLLKDGTSVWWQVQSRNKRSVALDLKDPAAQDIVRRLAAEADVLIENFRPGAMEGWGLGPDDLLALNPRLIMLRISGYGQTGPYRDKPGFGVVAEAMGGLRHLTAEPGRVPVRVGVSIGDTLAALHGVIGILLALQDRHRSGQGQVIDVALYEAVFNCMESLLPEYSAFGAVREPAGSALPGIAPSNAYRCSDGGYALIAGNGDSIFRRLMATIGRDDLGRDPALADNAGRVARVVEIDAAIGAWAAQRTVDEVLAALDARPRCRPGASTPWPTSLQGPALPGARHDRPGADGRRHRAGRARHHAQALAHARRHRRNAPTHGAGHRCRAARASGLTPAQIQALKRAAASWPAPEPACIASRDTSS
jgi:formyl-CoA transferase